MRDPSHPFVKSIPLRTAPHTQLTRTGHSAQNPTWGVNECYRDVMPTDHSPNLTLKANKGPSWNPNQQAARYTERMFMPRSELVLVARLKIPAESVPSGWPKHMAGDLPHVSDLRVQGLPRILRLESGGRFGFRNDCAVVPSFFPRRRWIGPSGSRARTFWPSATCTQQT